MIFEGRNACSSFGKGRGLLPSPFLSPFFLASRFLYIRNDTRSRYVPEIFRDYLQKEQPCSFSLLFSFFSKDYYELSDVDFEISRHLDATIATKRFPSSWRFKGENGPKKGTPLHLEEQ